jgi:hypothetical protein
MVVISLIHRYLLLIGVDRVRAIDRKVTYNKNTNRINSLMTITKNHIFCNTIPRWSVYVTLRDKLHTF